MKPTNGNQNSVVESYRVAIDTLANFTKHILFSFAMHSTDIKDVIIRNFIARAIVSLNGILKLWEIGDYQDCWVLYRCILDRLFHLTALARDNTFELFEKWSFKQQYDFNNKLRSDPDFKRKLDPNFFRDMDEQKERYLIISKERPKWERPKAEVVAREMDLMFLYKYGYDYASTLVHPMANDGRMDFSRLTNFKEVELFADPKIVITNSCLVVALLIQEGLNHSTLNWRVLIYDFLNNFLNFLKSDSMEYLLSFKKINQLAKNFDLCKKG